MKLINYSAEPQNKLYGWLPHTLKAEQVIFFPNACLIQDLIVIKQRFAPIAYLGQI